ncbi:MAG TPA: peptidoglycan bridge formation glycyltransferase FemA/FemB family protein, partial [Candidatus Bathyarchaeia archaeon]|nr:peptidoglycan bridge formation glycyltransferase FemA/FemB family protein [Candidatus Bathyarchaeia archaeon]
MTETKVIENKQIWEDFVLSSPDANFLHSWNWGILQQRLGKMIFRLGFFTNNKLKGVCLLVRQVAKRGVFLECPGGPLINWTKPVYFEEFVRQAKKIGEQKGCLFVRVRPQILETLANRLLFKKMGFIPAPMHLHAEDTLQLGLEKNEEQLLREMRKNTRYLVKKAAKEGVLIVQSKDVKDIDALYELQAETVKRSHFVPFPKNFFKEEFATFLKDDQIRIFKAVYQKKVLAVALIIFYGHEAVYHYSGSSSRFRKIPGSYLLQWEAILEAKRRGCKVYNFWGITPSGNLRHRFAGV